jgi:ribosomal subunit interface protein
MVMNANPTLTDVMVSGEISDRARTYVAEKIGDLARFAPVPVLSAHVRILRTAHRDPAKRFIIEVNLDARGRPVRAQVAAAGLHEAIDLARDRLRRKLSQLRQHPARQGGRDRAHRPGYLPRAAAEREVVRRKSFEPGRSAADEAAFDLEMMDYDFLLYTDSVSGVDSLVSRGGPTGYQITGKARAPQLSLAAAKGVLDLTDAPFVFFADTQSGRGNVLYRRHDGHYGLITPSA